MISARPLHSLWIMLIVLTIFGVAQTPPPVKAAPSWSSPILIDNNTALNTVPTALQAANGTLWIMWQSTINNQSTGRTDILYKTNTNGVWSNDHNLTTSGWNTGPSIIQLGNGTIMTFWSIKAASSYLVYSSLTNGGSWSIPVQITTTTLNDTSPSAAVGRDGAVWLVWTRTNSTNQSVPAIKQLYYKTLKNGVWSPETRLTSDSNQNFWSTVLVGKDGLVRVVWSKGAAGSVYQLFSKYYNGVSWSPDKQNITSTSTDVHPSLIQDRNGTLWLFWGRLVVVSTLVQYYELFEEYSYDLGRTWSSQIQLTPTPSTGGPYFDFFTPAAAQSTYGVKPIWIFCSSDWTGGSGLRNYDIFALTSTGIQNIHDVTVTKFSAANNQGTPWEYPGGFPAVGESAIETITVTVANIGDYLETINMTVTATNTTSITLGTVKHLIGPGNSLAFIYYWNTTNVNPARYGLSASITPLPGETLGNKGDNNAAVANQVHILPLGDIDQDGSVTLVDVGVIFYDFDFTAACNCSRWNPYADIHNTGIIDIVDVGVVSKNFYTFT